MTDNFEFELLFDLQLFAGEGAGAGGEGGGEGGEAGATEQEVAAPAPRRAGRRSKFEGVQFGIQENAANSRDAAGKGAADTAQGDESYESLIKGKYKAEHDAYVQKLLDGRFREQRQLQRQLGKTAPIIDELARRYGVEASDLDGLMQQLATDTRFYEDQAMREGVPVEMVMQREQLNRRQAAIDAQERRYMEESQRRIEMSQLLQEAVSLKAEIPDFDLDRELQNDAFARMVRKPPFGVGLPLRQAYYAANYAKIEAARRQQQSQALQSVARETARKVTNAVASGSRRPIENGVSSNATATIRDDPASWTKEERREVRRRVFAGEKIKL